MPQRYSLAAIALHWAIAALLAFQISVGWALEGLGARGFSLFQLHKSVGITILVLTLARIFIRTWKPRPPKLEGGWQGALASAVHAGLYVFMLGAPLTGWALVSTANVKVPTLVFGLIPLPHLPLPMGAHGAAEGAHGLLALLGIALFLLHVAGALRHHMLMGDGLLWRMMPGRSRVLLVLLPALILAGLVLGKAILPAPAPIAPKPVSVARDMDAPDEERAEVPANATNTVAPADNGAEEAKPAAPPPAWAVQPGGSIGFSVGNGAETIAGRFGKWTADIVMDPDHPDSAAIKVVIDLASATVGDDYQDGMLAGEEFFAVAAHPSAIFTAKGAEQTGANSYRARGTLSLKGVSRPQTIRFTLAGTGKTRKVSGSASIARAPFGVGNGGSSGDMAPDVALTFAFSATAR
ncbi:MAG: YceI family protein [Sphingobium sp.]